LPLAKVDESLVGLESLLPIGQGLFEGLLLAVFKDGVRGGVAAAVGLNPDQPLESILSPRLDSN